jgi:glycerol-1-phosphatase
VTNNALRTPATVAGHLTELGIPAEASDIVTSAQAVARLISEQVPPGSRVLVVGGEGLRVALRERGLVPVDSAEDEPAAVVQGYGGPDLAWGRLAEACYAIARGVPWFASNTDLTVPSARGIAPGNGAAVEVVRIATGAEPQVAGKPLPPMHRETILRTGARRPLVVGDRLDTDIEGAFEGGVDSLLVLTGVTRAAQLPAAPPRHRPTYVDADLRGLLTGQPDVVPGEGGAEEGRGLAFRCAGWTAWAGRERLELRGDGAPLDGLRALCAAAWTAAGDGTCGLDADKAVARLGL